MGMSRWGVRNCCRLSCAQREVWLCYVSCTLEVLHKCFQMNQKWHPTLRNAKQSFIFSSHLNIVHKEGLGRRDGHGCICFTVLYKYVGHLMPIPRWHICLIKCKPTSLSLLRPSWCWLFKTGTCHESPVNMVCKGRWWLLGNSQMKTNALLSFYEPRLSFH